MLFDPSKILHFTFYTLHLDEAAPRAPFPVILRRKIFPFLSS